jgi:hypothetical protein
MSNLYMPNTTTGTISTWKRACKIEITNPITGSPSAIFSEEIATALPDGTFISKHSTSLSENATDMTLTFPLLDPATGNVVGSMTYGQLYAAMYSLYLNLAAERDAEVAAINAGNGN